MIRFRDDASLSNEKRDKYNTLSGNFRCSFFKKSAYQTGGRTVITNEIGDRTAPDAAETIFYVLYNSQFSWRN